MEASFRYYTNCIQIIDVADPAKPNFVANWWVPGQRREEEAEYKKWREYGDKTSFTSLHGPMYVPKQSRGGRSLRLQRLRLVRDVGPRSH